MVDICELWGNGAWGFWHRHDRLGLLGVRVLTFSAPILCAQWQTFVSYGGMGHGASGTGTIGSGFWACRC
ncbi:MAG: hypothetical protein KME26_01840 [Oscillatoria princeps RMCB-10]|nr:hypothetical protein [Oscillatoria princeps RMCB-10]